MSDIKGRCPHCGKTFKVPAEYKDKGVKCPSCKEPIVIQYKSEPITETQQQLNNLKDIKSSLSYTLCPIWFIVCLLSYSPGMHPAGILIGSVIGSLILTYLTVGLIELVTKYVLAIIKSER